MVSANEKGQVGCGAGSGIILVEVADGAVFGGYGHCREVIAVADCLKQSASACLFEVFREKGESGSKGVMEGCTWKSPPMMRSSMPSSQPLISQVFAMEA